MKGERKKFKNWTLSWTNKILKVWWKWRKSSTLNSKKSGQEKWGFWVRSCSRNTLGLVFGPMSKMSTLQRETLWIKITKWKFFGQKTEFWRELNLTQSIKKCQTNWKMWSEKSSKKILWAKLLTFLSGNLQKIRKACPTISTFWSRKKSVSFT